MVLPFEHTPVISNRSMPESVVIPVLMYPDVRSAVDWLCRAFGFVERLREGETRAQLVVGGGAILVTTLPADAVTWPDSGPGHAIMVRVDELDHHYERARKAGARIIIPPANHEYGERQYAAEDIGGHCWTFSQSIADVDPRTWGGELLV